MIVKNESGREIMIEVYGTTEDIEIDEAYYLDDEEDITEEDLDYIKDVFATELQEAASSCQLSFDFMGD
jgi:hypothetical protein